MIESPIDAIIKRVTDYQPRWEYKIVDKMNIKELKDYGDASWELSVIHPVTKQFIFKRKKV